MILTVTMNVAIDRSLRVPNFQVGHRHRASEAFAQAGGKGINVARALKNLDLPVVATGLAGGRTGTRVVEELTAEGILNDFVRISAESRTSTIVVDETGGTTTEVYERGPHVEPEELETLLEKIAYLARGADLVVFAGSLPRGVEDGFYEHAIRECNRRRIRAVLDAEGQALRLGVEAEPWLVSPNQREAESLVGQEFHDDEDFLMALDAIAELGARNVLIGHNAGAYLLDRAERRVQRFTAVVPPVEPVTQEAGAGDAMLAGYLAARAAEESAEVALRRAVAVGAAATLTVGGGRFDRREAQRFEGSVEVGVLEHAVPEL
jgi:1-phosphofructokinase family hexose kinase